MSTANLQQPAGPGAALRLTAGLLLLALSGYTPWHEYGSRQLDQQVNELEKQDDTRLLEEYRQIAGAIRAAGQDQLGERAERNQQAVARALEKYRRRMELSQELRSPAWLMWVVSFFCAIGGISLLIEGWKRLVLRPEPNQPLQQTGPP